MEEWLTQVTDTDEIIGPIPRSQCHGNPALIHRSIHILVLNHQGLILLQKRSLSKDMEPGKWDSSVGGHVSFGQSYQEAALREAQEELGFTPEVMHFLYALRIRDLQESENIHSYLVFADGPFNPCPDEIDEIRFWNKKEIEINLGSGLFTPNFELDFQQFLLSQWAHKLQ
jgi:isopentenyldiphosphate isomerase